jgi:hypothetical protein
MLELILHLSFAFLTTVPVFKLTIVCNMIMRVRLLFHCQWTLSLFYFIGCRRISSSNDSGSDICRYSENEPYRPSNKTEAMEEDVIGNTVIGTTGGAAASQRGVYVCACFCRIEII